MIYVIQALGAAFVGAIFAEVIREIIKEGR